MGAKRRTYRRPPPSRRTSRAPRTESTASAPNRAVTISVPPGSENSGSDGTTIAITPLAAPITADAVAEPSMPRE